ncbi:MAG: copper resistance protein CopC [Methylococcus sp.]|nr:copper resistance protein CopC [Methylococcus sp.]
MTKTRLTLAMLVAGSAWAGAAEAALSPQPVFANASVGAWTAVPNPFLARGAESPLPVRLAHAILVKAIPERDATITDIPEEIHLTFNEGVGTEFLALAVVDDSGKRVDKHDAKLDFTDHSNLRASVSGLAAGRYMVRYRVLSADGHVVSGKYYFQIQPK